MFVVITLTAGRERDDTERGKHPESRGRRYQRRLILDLGVSASGWGAASLEFIARKLRTASAEMARPNSHPWASEQPKSASAFLICSDSTPSAVIGTSRLCPKPAI